MFGPSDMTGRFDTSEHRSLRAGLGPFVIADLDVGWSSSVKGKLWGRLKLPLSVPGYLWVSLKVLGRNVLFGCFQLS